MQIGAITARELAAGARPAKDGATTTTKAGASTAKEVSAGVTAPKTGATTAKQVVPTATTATGHDCEGGSRRWSHDRLEGHDCEGSSRRCTNDRQRSAGKGACEHFDNHRSLRFWPLSRIR